MTMTEAPAAEEAPDRGHSVLVVRGWGADKPGISDSFVKVVVQHHCRVLDMAQFLLEGSLLCTFVLYVGDQSSMALMKDLSKCAKEKDLQLDFHFPDAGELDSLGASENVAAISVVSKGRISPALLHDVDTVLCSQGCAVVEIEHRSDNKRENNGEYNKVQLRVKCPRGLKLATLHVGMPLASGGTAPGLQKVAWEYGAEVTVRWWDAMNRPNGKSLVVFGLSHVLCPWDCLDEVLKEAGLDPAAADGSSTTAKNQSKVAMLKGKSTQVVQKVIDRLEFTPGARLVCGALKRMGFRLAVLTNTGVQDMAEHAKRELGIDYAICRDLGVADGCFTGEYAGELSDVRFRKMDLMKLMADREGIDCRNVIVVGEPLQGLSASNARLFLETFGPNVFFNSTKLKDLTIALYLLGFNGSDIRALRKRRWEDGPGEGAAQQAHAPKSKRFMMQVSSHTLNPGQINRIFAPLKPLDSQVHVATVRHCSLQGGGMCLGLELGVEREDPDQVVKDLLYACQQQGFQVKDVGNEVVEASKLAPRTASSCWQHYFQNRHVITLVQKPHIANAVLSATFGTLAQQHANVVKIERLSASRELAALQLTVNLPEGLEPAELSGSLAEVAKQQGADIAFQRDDLERWMRRLVVFDMDSTLIQQEVIDELAKMAGVETQVKAITEAAMRGELNFFDSLKSRVALLKGHKADELFAKVKANLIFTPGAKKLCSTLRSMGLKMAVISGGFLPVAQEVQRHLGLDYAFANTLEVDETTGLLTGRTSGPVVTPQRKRALLATIANVEGCEVQQTIAVGDGANDIPMLNAAGLGIAFCAKPKVQAATEFRINQKDLSTVLFLIGVSERAAERLTPADEAAESGA
mmetsp:Transcript_55360/g.177564  ORF Transcript_55360/g.177564 Transcript_55360/m.177564 type:complete len:863 (+) Transcript_55360:57-2645(+)